MKQKLLNRKRRALRWVLFAACLGVLTWALIPIHLSASSAHHQAVEERFIKPTKIVSELASPTSVNLIFAINDEVLCMGTYVPIRWRGWQHTGLLETVEREPDRPFTVGYLDIADGDMPMHPVDYYYVFGVIQDDRVERIEIKFRADTGGHDQRVLLSRDDWSVTDTGEQYFLWELEPEVENFGRALYATGYLEDSTPTQTYYMTSFLGWE